MLRALPSSIINSLLQTNIWDIESRYIEFTAQTWQEMFILHYLHPVCQHLIFVLGPKREVISIYNENFTTPQFKSPYFIEVYRCVELAAIDDVSKCGSDNYPVPHNWTEIGIVVPDLSDEVKFYKYIIYNHTFCKCGGTADTERKFWNDTVELGESITQHYKKLETKWLHSTLYLC